VQIGYIKARQLVVQIGYIKARQLVVQIGYIKARQLVVQIGYIKARQLVVQISRTLTCGCNFAKEETLTFKCVNLYITVIK